MKWICVGLALLLLAGCVPVPQPFHSPLPGEPSEIMTYYPAYFPTPEPFSSPLAPPQGQLRTYIPRFIWPEPSKFGLSQALLYRNCEDIDFFRASWHYDWSPQPLNCSTSEAVPMIWNAGDGINNPPPPSRYILLFNECDLAGQCDTDPETIARWWHRYEEMFPNRKLVGPNASHLGMDWLLAWHAAYVRLYGKPPRMWALGIHCYSLPETCKAWVTENSVLAEQWTESGKVWLTEWAMADCYYTGTQTQQTAQAIADAEEFQLWLHDNPAVGRVAWFIVRLDGERCKTALMDAEGITPFGAWYAQTER